MDAQSVYTMLIPKGAGCLNVFPFCLDDLFLDVRCETEPTKRKLQWRAITMSLMVQINTKCSADLARMTGAQIIGLTYKILH